MSYEDEVLDAGFEGERLVPIAQPGPIDDADRIEDALLEAGVDPARIPGAVVALEDLLEGLAISRAAEGLRHLVRSMPPTAARAALERALLGDDRPAREVAAEIGVSHTAVLKSERKIRARLPEGFPSPR